MVSRGLLALVAAVAPVLAQEVSTDGSCSGTLGFTCLDSDFGNCCSKYGYCGSSDTYCGTGCQSEYGDCSDAETPVSDDSSCGADSGFTCLGSGFGDCCSAYGYCGTGDTYCSAGCQSEYGSCDDGADTISTDGTCGADGGITCLGSDFGDCCSAYGYCGSTSVHCGPDCQGDYGTCTSDETSTSSATSDETSTSSATSAEPEETLVSNLTEKSKRFFKHRARLV